MGIFVRAGAGGAAIGKSANRIYGSPIGGGLASMLVNCAAHAGDGLDRSEGGLFIPQTG